MIFWLKSIWWEQKEKLNCYDWNEKQYWTKMIKFSEMITKKYWQRQSTRMYIVQSRLSDHQRVPFNWKVKRQLITKSPTRTVFARYGFEPSQIINRLKSKPIRLLSIWTWSNRSNFLTLSHCVKPLFIIIRIHVSIRWRSLSKQIRNCLWDLDLFVPL